MKFFLDFFLKPLEFYKKDLPFKKNNKQTKNSFPIPRLKTKLPECFIWKMKKKVELMAYVLLMSRRPTFIKSTFFESTFILWIYEYIF